VLLLACGLCGKPWTCEVPSFSLSLSFAYSLIHPPLMSIRFLLLLFIEYFEYEYKFPMPILFLFFTPIVYQYKSVKTRNIVRLPRPNEKRYSPIGKRRMKIEKEKRSLHPPFAYRGSFCFLLLPRKQRSCPKFDATSSQSRSVLTRKIVGLTRVSLRACVSNEKDTIVPMGGRGICTFSGTTVTELPSGLQNI
jgi:hypothetical protein